MGFKNVATRYLSKGDTEGAGRAFGEALVIALSLSVIVMILTLMFTPTVVAGLGIRMIMTEAKEVKYTSMFRLNNLLIRIGTKETKKKDPKKKADEESAE